VGALVTEQLSVTVPVNELPGVTVRVTALEVAPGATVTLVGLAARVKPVVLEVFGASQKSPQPVRKHSATGAAASIQCANLTIFIRAPLYAVKRPRRLLGPHTGYPLTAHLVLPPGALAQPDNLLDAKRVGSA
jgi:hypothetical protein